MKSIIYLLIFPFFAVGQIVIHDEVDTTGAHPVLVKQRLIATLAQYFPITPFVHYSQNYNIGEDYPPDIISNHSYAWGNLSGGVNNYAKGILTVIAHGANTSIEVFGLANNEPWVRVAAVSKDTANNNTSFGSGLDFVERTDDPPFVCTVPCQSSATPKVTAKLYVIKHRVDSICGCDTDWFDIVWRAKATASNGGTFQDRTGYGIIDVNAAVSYSGSYPENDWVDYEFPAYISPVLSDVDSFPRKTSLNGTELFKTYRNETNGYNSEFTASTFKNYVLQYQSNGAISTTTDESGDITVTIPAMPDATYTSQIEITGTGTNYLTQVHTKTTTSFKVRFKVSSTEASVGAGVGIAFDYDVKDY